MLDPTSPTVARYRLNRAKGIPARPALAYAKTEAARPTLDWDIGRSNQEFKVAKFEREGFQVVAEARTYPEDCADACSGHFTDRESTTTVRNPEAWDREGNYRTRSRLLRYFEPGCSYQDHFRALRRSYTRHEAHNLARSYVQSELKRALNCGEEWTPVTLFVRVFRAGIELGSANVGGYATDDEESFWEDSIEDILYEALDEARKTLAALCSPAPGTVPCTCACTE